VTTLKAEAKVITADWSAAFPMFDVYKPLWLMRRIGPVVQGIVLDKTRSNDEYIPTSHVHSLTRDFPVISLMLGQRADRVSVSRHSRDYALVASELRNQSVLPLDEAPIIDDIVNACHTFARGQQERGYPPAVPEMEDSLLISAASDRPDLVQASLTLAIEFAEVWPQSRLPLDWTSSQEWLDELRSRIADPSQVRDIVADQILKHKLGKIRDA
jgi:hypothetical protein